MPHLWHSAYKNNTCLQAICTKAGVFITLSKVLSALPRQRQSFPPVKPDIPDGANGGSSTSVHTAQRTAPDPDGLLTSFLSVSASTVLSLPAPLPVPPKFRSDRCAAVHPTALFAYTRTQKTAPAHPTPSQHRLYGNHSHKNPALCGPAAQKAPHPCWKNSGKRTCGECSSAHTDR